MLRRLFKAGRELRWDLIVQASDDSLLVTPGKDHNEQYQGQLRYIQNNRHLTKSEKEKAKEHATWRKDHRNLIDIKGPTYQCEKCYQQSFTIANCEHCMRNRLRAQFDAWTSGKDSIDKAIQECQLKCPLARSVIEWIPYEDLHNVVHKTKGGSSSIYTAMWMKGEIYSLDKETQIFIRSRPLPVILKRIMNSDKPNEKFLNEIKQHLLLGSTYSTSIIRCHGVTRDPTTLEYMLVIIKMQIDLGFYIKENYFSLKWRDINHMFLYITSCLCILHEDDLVHKDLHPGNILRSKDNQWGIADFGLCGPANQSPNSVYGNLAYMAPEVIRNAQYSTAADIYTVGMLMYHVATGHRPFKERQNDIDLASNICDGIRPPINRKFPAHYKDLMKKCWNADTSKRPSARQLGEYFTTECRKTAKSSDYGRELVNQHNALPIEDDIGQSSIYEFKDLPIPRNATLEEQEEYTRQYSFKSL